MVIRVMSGTWNWLDRYEFSGVNAIGDPLLASSEGLSYPLLKSVQNKLEPYNTSAAGIDAFFGAVWTHSWE